MLAALKDAQHELRIAYAAAYCGPQDWTPEVREQCRVNASHADSNARAAIAKATAWRPFPLCAASPAAQQGAQHNATLHKPKLRPAD